MLKSPYLQPCSAECYRTPHILNMPPRLKYTNPNHSHSKISMYFVNCFLCFWVTDIDKGQMHFIVYVVSDSLHIMVFCFDTLPGMHSTATVIVNSSDSPALLTMQRPMTECLRAGATNKHRAHALGWVGGLKNSKL